MASDDVQSVTDPSGLQYFIPKGDYVPPGSRIGAVPDYSDRFNTELSPGQESSFQGWMSGQSQKLGRDVSQDLNDYDLRGWWRENMGSELTGAHLTDQYKKPNHPTFSDQSIYSGAGALGGGHWGNDPGGAWNFTPGTGSLWSPEDLQRYFGRFEPGNRLIPVEHDPFNEPPGTLPFGQAGGPGQGGVRMGAGDMLALQDRAMAPRNPSVEAAKSVMSGLGAVGSELANSLVESGKPLGEVLHNLYYGQGFDPAAATRAIGEQFINAPAFPEGTAAGIGKAIIGGIAGRMLPHEEQGLNLAKVLLSRNVDQGDIWRKTGWYKHPTDQIWRREIPGENFQFKKEFLNELRDKQHPEAGANIEALARGDITNQEYDKFIKEAKQPVYNGKLSDFVEFPELFKAYPQLADMKVTFDSSIKTAGTFKPNLLKKVLGPGRLELNPSLNDDQMRMTLGHELQHAVQYIEGFPGQGANAGKVKELISKALQEKHLELVQREDAAHATGDPAKIMEINKETEDFANLVSRVMENPDLATWLYRSEPGELEAELAARRHFLLPVTNKAFSPIEMQRKLTVGGLDPFAIKPPGGLFIDRLRHFFNNVPPKPKSWNALSRDYQMLPEFRFPGQFGVKAAEIFDFERERLRRELLTGKKAYEDSLPAPSAKADIEDISSAIEARNAIRSKLDNLYSKLSDLMDTRKSAGEDVTKPSPMEQRITDQIDDLSLRQRIMSGAASPTDVRNYLSRQLAELLPVNSKNRTQVEALRERISAMDAVLTPKPFMDRIWDNYVRNYDLRKGWPEPDSFLHSEAVWGGARELSESTGMKEHEAFAQIANDMFRRGGSNQHMTPEAARKFMGEQRGIKLAPKSYQEIIDEFNESVRKNYRREEAERRRQNFKLVPIEHNPFTEE